MNRKSRRALKQTKITVAPKRHWVMNGMALATLLGTSTMLASPDALATIIPCATSITSNISGPCEYVSDTDISIGNHFTNAASVTARPGTSYAILVDTDYSHTLTNNGTITSSQDHLWAEGIYIDSNVLEGGSIINNGFITTNVINANGRSALSIYVSQDMDGSITNNGTITASASDAAAGVASAYGVYVNGTVTGTITNNGSITATAQAAANSATAAGIYVDSDLDGSVINNGSISVTANASTDEPAHGYGIAVNDSLNGNITNNGTITTAVTSNTNAEAQAFGIYVNGSASGNILNAGTITTTASNSHAANAYGIYVDGNLSGNITNNGHIVTMATGTRGQAYGIDIRGVASGNVINNGTIISTGNGSHGYANGIITEGVSNTGWVINNGSIITQADGSNAWATAMASLGGGGVAGAFINNGTISMEGHGGTGMYVSGGVSGAATNNGSITMNMQTDAFGIDVSGGVTGIVTNSGTINLSAGSSAYGIEASSVSNTGSIVNHGTIVAEAGFENAYGIYVDGAMNGTITNDGLIIAQSTYTPYHAYSIYAQSGTGSVDNEGALYGILHLGGTISVTNNGDLILPGASNGANASVIGGNYIQGANAVLGIGVASPTAYSHLNVTGTADFTAGNQLAVTLEPGNTYAGGALNSAVSAGSTGPSSYSVVDNSLAYNFTGTKSGNVINITPTATGLTTFSDAVGSAGFGSGTGAAAALDSFFANGIPADLATGLGNIGTGVTTAQGASNAVAQVLPLLTGGVQNVIKDGVHTTDNIIQSRLDAHSGYSSGESITSVDRHFWLKPFGSWANQDDRGGATGYTANTGGVVLGADASVNAKTILGVAFAYSHSNVDGNNDAAPQKDRINGYQGSVYGSYDLGNRMSLNLQGDVGDNTNDGNRYISFAGVNAHSSFDTWAEHVGVGVERSYQLCSKAVFIPELRADYANISSDSYTETGAGGFNNNVASSNTQELILGLNGKAAYSLADHISLSANLGVGYDTINDRASVTSNFVGGGAAFVTRGIDQSPWIGRAGAGLTFSQFHNLELSARYDLEARSDYTDQTASLKLRAPF